MKVLRIISGFFLFCIASLNVLAQESAELVQEPSAKSNFKELGKTFYDTRIVNGQSVETNNEGVMKFIIAHRFGTVNGGAYELFGLDQSTIRIGFDYGISDRLSVGIGRSSNEKTFDGFLKYKILQQASEGAPLSLVYYGNIAARGLDWPNDSLSREFKHRLFYTHQLLLACKFSDRFSAQLMPSFLHRSLGMTEKFFIGETRGSWSEGDIRIGFNITRDFKIKGRKER